MSRRTAENSRSTLGAQSLQSYSGLPPTTVPLDQLQQIQKRLQALVLSTGQLQMEVAMSPTLDWPTILSRFGTLVSQTYSLSSSLTSSSSAFLPAQLDEVHRALEEEAKRDNYFLHDEDVQEGTALGREGTSGNGPHRLRYTDPRNPLPKLVAVPVLPLQAGTDKVGRLGEVLRTKLDPEVVQLHQDLIDSASGTKVSQEQMDEKTKLREISQTLEQHDNFARRALRAWHHVRWRPDEEGQTYDFKMRLGEDDEGQVEEDANGEVDDEGDGVAEAAEVQLEGGGEHSVVPKEEAADTEGGDEVQEEDDEDDEDDDEEMEDIDVS